MSNVYLEKIEELRQVVNNNYLNNKYTIKNKEQTKNWLVLPFLDALGYNTYSSDVVPNDSNDTDYVLQVGNKPIAIIGCIKFMETLGSSNNQMYKEYLNLGVHIGILTNGIDYWFFTDGQEDGIMDKAPYLRVRLIGEGNNISSLCEYTKCNIKNAEIPSIENKRKREIEIEGYKSQIKELHSKMNNIQSLNERYDLIFKQMNETIESLRSQIDETNEFDDNAVNAMIINQMLNNSYIRNENKNLKCKLDAVKRGSRDKKFYGGSTLDKQRVPYDIAMSMVEKIPSELFTPTAKFLDPFCRYGEFLSAVRDRAMKEKSMIDAFPDADDRYDYISDNMLYALVIDKEGLKDVKRVIHGTSNPKNSHVVCFESEDTYKTIIKYNHISLFSEKLKELGQMKFDVVIGNPPYQGNDGRSSIYPDFVNISMKLADTVCMITRDNWLTGMAFEKMRSNMNRAGGVKYIKHYPIQGEVFNDVGVAVAYFLWERGYEGDTNYIRVEQGDVVSKRNVDIDRFIMSDIASGIISKVPVIDDWASIYNSRSYPFMDQRKRYSLDKADRSSEYYNVAIMANKEKTTYTNIENFRNKDEVRKYNVVCGNNANEATEALMSNVLTNIKALGPMQVSSETWSLIASFDSAEEVLNCKKYIKTRLVRFLASQTVNVRAGVTKNTFKFIPNQNFTNSSDIDWSKSVEDIDKQLYNKYGLNAEEIDYIERLVKPME